jgi:hypothetical protein
MPVIAGSVWVEGQYLHFCPTTTTEYRYLGTYVANRSTALAGSMWVEGQFIRYIDSNKDERYLPLGAASTPAGVSSAINGSVWIENNRLNSIQGLDKVKREYHGDTSHADDPGYDDHSDHLDQHTDTPHGDNPPKDTFYDFPMVYLDTPYQDGGPHQDNTTHDDHSDHGDTPHADEPTFVGTV